MLLKDVLQKTTTFFTEKGFSSPRLDTELLFARALNWDRIRIYMNYDYPLNEKELEACRSLIRRRAQGEPIAYILGSRDFYKANFEVEPGVLIPRPETEGIVEDALAWMAKQPENQNGFRVVDFGCGSGCIGLSILKENSQARLLAVDASPVAIRVTQKNAERLELCDRVSVLQSRVEELTDDDIGENLFGPADVIVANPPYIAPDDPEVESNVRKFEPAEALFSDEDGLGHIRRWADVAARIARPGAFIMFEIGAGQSAAARQFFSGDSRFQSVEVVKDLAQHERFIRCLKGGEKNHG